MSPDDPRHGKNAGYVNGCRCDRCRKAHARESKTRALHPRPLLPAAGTRRRLQALHRLGWSGAELSRRAGRSQFWVQQVLLQEKVQQTTADVVRAMYDDLSMTWNTSVSAGRTAAAARSKGWAPPLAWDEGEIDDPDARPYAEHTGVDVDEVVVERVLSGEWRLPTTRAEKVEISRRWYASGRSLGELNRATGWKPERYFKVGDVEAGAAA